MGASGCGSRRRLCSSEKRRSIDDGGGGGGLGNALDRVLSLTQAQGKALVVEEVGCSQCGALGIGCGMACDDCARGGRRQRDAKIKEVRARRAKR